jgi:hypothetical protein
MARPEMVDAETISNRGETMRSSKWSSESHVSLDGDADAAGWRVGQSAWQYDDSAGSPIEGPNP